jgi:hypothetical protein
MQVKQLATESLERIIKSELKKIMNEAPLNVMPSDVKSKRDLFSQQQVSKAEAKIEEMYPIIEDNVKGNFHNEDFLVAHDFKMEDVDVLAFETHGFPKLKNDLERNGFIDVTVKKRVEDADGSARVIRVVVKFSMPKE